MDLPALTPAPSAAALAQAENLLLSKVAAAGASGVLHSVLKGQLANLVDVRTFNEAVRNLRASQKIAFERQGQDHVILMMRLKTGLSDNFTLVLEVIRTAGTAGIDPATIASKTKLIRTEVTKGLAALTAQGFVKTTRCFQNKARRLYILAELQPSADVTGGTFYTEARDIDNAFIDRLRLLCAEHVEERVVASSGDIKEVLDAEEPGRRLTAREVETVMGTLVADGVVEIVGGVGPVAVDGYRVSRYRMATSAAAAAQLRGASGASGGVAPGRGAAPFLWRSLSVAGVVGGLGAIGSSGPLSLLAPIEEAAVFPCIRCPQLDQCSPLGTSIVSPASCPFLTEFLAVTAAPASAGAA